MHVWWFDTIYSKVYVVAYICAHDVNCICELCITHYTLYMRIVRRTLYRIQYILYTIHIQCTVYTHSLREYFEVYIQHTSDAVYRCKVLILHVSTSCKSLHLLSRSRRGSRRSRVVGQEVVVVVVTWSEVVFDLDSRVCRIV